jgi:hypothetical protein
LARLAAWLTNNSLLQKFVHDLRTTVAPVYKDILQRLLDLLPRSISPASLTTLLETFNCLFRYLLVPSIHLDLLEQTWTSLKATLPKCLPEIQRAMAEVWGSVLRKLKTTARAKAVTLLAKAADPVDDASAWVLVYACKVRSNRGPRFVPGKLIAHPVCITNVAYRHTVHLFTPPCVSPRSGGTRSNVQPSSKKLNGTDSSRQD